MAKRSKKVGATVKTEGDMFGPAIAALKKTGRFTSKDRAAILAACKHIAARDNASGSIVQGFSSGLLRHAILGEGPEARRAGRIYDNLKRITETLSAFMGGQSIPPRLRDLCSGYIEAWQGFDDGMKRLYETYSRRMQDPRVQRLYRGG